MAKTAKKKYTLPQILFLAVLLGLTALYGSGLYNNFL